MPSIIIAAKGLEPLVVWVLFIFSAFLNIKFQLSDIENASWKQLPKKYKQDRQPTDGEWIPKKATSQYLHLN
jgi:hypothetical protein